MVVSAILHTWLVTSALSPAPTPVVSSTEPKVSWAADLRLASLAAIPAELDRPIGARWKIEVRLGPPEGPRTKRTIRTCRELLDVAKVQFDVVAPRDWNRFWSDGVRCFALDNLLRAVPARKSYLAWFDGSPSSIERLSPRLTMSIAPDDIEDASKAESACKSWKQYDDSLTVRSNAAGSASLRAEGWTGRLAIYGRGDFDGDGLEDLLIGRDAHSNEGSARDTSLFVVTQTSPRPCVLVTRLIGPASVNGM